MVPLRPEADPSTTLPGHPSVQYNAAHQGPMQAQCLFLILSMTSKMEGRLEQFEVQISNGAFDSRWVSHSLAAHESPLNGLINAANSILSQPARNFLNRENPAI